MKINISLNTKSIDNAIAQIKLFQKNIVSKLDIVCERLAILIKEEAYERFINAEYDGVNNVEVTYTRTNNGYVVTANGNAVLFIEFGAGVHYNGVGGSYPDNKPSGLANIGEYGKGHGKNEAWGFYWGGNTNDLVVTRGNPPAAAMFYAKENAKQQIVKICKEVFGNG